MSAPRVEGARCWFVVPRGPYPVGLTVEPGTPCHAPNGVPDHPRCFARSVNGYEVRSKEFRLGLQGYNKNDVDKLLDGVAIALDRDQSPASIIKEANFRNGFRGYQVDEVDQFLKGCLSATHDGVRAVADPSTISAPPQR